MTILRTAALAVVLSLPLAAVLPLLAQQKEKPVVAIPRAGVPQIMTIEGTFVRAAYNNEGYVILGYQFANRSVGEEWLLLEVGMTVLDNMLLGAQKQFGERMLGSLLRPVWRREEQSNTERALSLLERFRLLDKRNDMAGSLSGGQRKLLEMARALMTDPGMIMLDEPMAGVNPALVQSLLGHITSLREEGKTVLFVEHDMDVIMDVSDWIVVLAQGQVIAEGTPAAIASNKQVIDAYLGSQEDDVVEAQEGTDE